MQWWKGSQPDKPQGAQGVVTMFGIPVARGMLHTCSTYRQWDWNDTLSVYSMESIMASYKTLSACLLHDDYLHYSYILFKTESRQKQKDSIQIFLE